ncbi:hypothetical protein OFC57_40150, partial [Escherichia coli]|nr:hypothetical protein [Escherichia coli]
PTFFKIKNIADAEFYAETPVIGTIPLIRTQEEVDKMRRFHILKIVIGTFLFLLSTPLLIMVLERTHIFERFY